MDILKITDVNTKENLILTVTFADGKSRNYDCHKVLNRNDHYKQLEDIHFFKNVHIDTGGHALSWSDYVDISEFEILEN